MGYKYINKIGVELEGGWSINSSAYNNVYGDGSVNYLYNDDDGDEDARGHKGEVSSPPLMINECIEYINENYPDKFDSSCGIHFHISFKTNKYTTVLTDSAFYEYFKNEFVKWGLKNKIPESDRFWSRLNGDNEFCTRDFIPYKQLYREASRYTQINFCSIKKHNTVEFRLFPVFETRKLTISALKNLVRIVNSFIDKHHKAYSQTTNIKIKI